MVNANVVVIVHVNSKTHQLINSKTHQLVNLLPSPRRGVGGEAPRQLVYSSTRQLKKMSLFLTNATRKIEKNGGAFDALSHEWRDEGLVFSAC